MFKHIITFLLVAVTLSACDFPESDWYYYHPNVLTYVFKKCQANDDFSSPRCKAAYYAARELDAYSRAFISDQQAFGKAIIEVETRLADIAGQLSDDSSSDTLDDTKAELEQQRDKMLFIVRWYASPA